MRTIGGKMYTSKQHYEKKTIVAGKAKPAYKEKKKTDNGYVWVYDDAHIKKRWEDKRKKAKKLEKGIKNIRKKYEKDLSDDDPKTRAIAAIVGLIDETSIRIGNKQSAEEAKTYGATTLKIKHVSFNGSRAKLKFVGKSNVDQDLTVKNSKVVKILKELAKGKKNNDFIFEIDGDRIWDRAVNRYLSEFDISAKDIRGFNANKIMKEQLKKHDWKRALEETASIVGHEVATLKNQYLMPELVEKHEKKESKIKTRYILKRGDRAMIKTLTLIANKLDSKGLYKLADEMDQIIKSAISQSDLIRALKENDKNKAMSALNVLVRDSSGPINEELGMTKDKFREFANSIRNDDLDAARNLMGIGSFTSSEHKVMPSDELDTSKYSPLTGLPWKSGPVEKETNPWVQEVLGDIEKIKDILNGQIAYAGEGARADGCILNVVIKDDIGDIQADVEDTYDDLHQMGLQENQMDIYPYTKTYEVGQSDRYIFLELSKAGLASDYWYLKFYYDGQNISQDDIDKLAIGAAKL